MFLSLRKKNFTNVVCRLPGTLSFIFKIKLIRNLMEFVFLRFYKKIKKNDRKDDIGKKVKKMVYVKMVI